MRIIISPAKKMNVDTDSLPWRDLPCFLPNMAENQIDNPEEIKAFNRLDYQHDPERSDEATYVFVRKGKTTCSLD